MKKPFSKKRGFTLVEIVVAFAVFAIFAMIIAQVINLTINRKNQNLAFEKSVQQEQENLLLNKLGDSGYNSGDSATGSLKFDFGEGEMNIDYQMKDTNGDIGNAGGINYFVGDLDATANDGAGNSSTPSGGSSVVVGDSSTSVRDPGADAATLMGKLQVGITGTKGLNYVRIKVTKISDTEYEIEARADDSTVEQSNIKQYPNFSLYFPDEFKIQSVKDANQYRSDISITKSGNGVKVSVTGTGDNASLNKDWNIPKFTVTLKEAPASGNVITAKTFGDNASGNTTEAQYTCYSTNLNGTTYIFDNVYGATVK